MSTDYFFDEQKDQSLVKSTIVAKYFDVWANVIICTQKKYPHYDQRIAYIDLFAGPGRYKDGTISTPIKILENAVQKEDLKERLITIFNDKDESNSLELERAISEIRNIKSLKYKPEIWNQEIGEKIVAEFERINLIPTLFFVDPWGYKGLSLRLVNSVLKDWGCDSMFFFNYNRINMGLSNEKIESHMNALFGDKRCDKLRSKLKNKNPSERELIIIEELCIALKEYGSRFVLPFRFKNEQGERTSHHLIFVSKNATGYEIMKEIMAKESTNDVQGVPSFEYNPADFLPQQSLLFQLSRPLYDLRDSIIEEFRGTTIRMVDLFKMHNIDTPFIKKNYKDVLKELYDSGIIDAQNKKGNPPRKGTFGDEILITFK